jgi:hypothetical protein
MVTTMVMILRMVMVMMIIGYLTPNIVLINYPYATF